MSLPRLSPRVAPMAAEVGRGGGCQNGGELQAGGSKHRDGRTGQGWSQVGGDRYGRCRISSSFTDGILPKKFIRMEYFNRLMFFLYNRNFADL